MPLTDDNAPEKKLSHEIGQNLDALSVAELGERVALLEEEILRLKAARERKAASLKAAESVFKF